MHAIAASLLLLAGTVSAGNGTDSGYVLSSDSCETGCCHNDCGHCNSCRSHGKSRCARAPFGGKVRGAAGSYNTGADGARQMPQSCYEAHYGCYPANHRFMHRYTAFHGYYYRRPYNYRNLFDYPWHARLHEPTSLFSYHVPEAQIEEIERGEIAPGVEPLDGFRSSRESYRQPSGDAGDLRLKPQPRMIPAAASRSPTPIDR